MGRSCRGRQRSCTQLGKCVKRGSESESPPQPSYLFPPSICIREVWRRGLHSFLTILSRFYQHCEDLFNTDNDLCNTRSIKARAQYQHGSAWIPRNDLLTRSSILLVTLNTLNSMESSLESLEMLTPTMNERPS